MTQPRHLVVGGLFALVLSATAAAQAPYNPLAWWAGVDGNRPDTLPLQLPSSAAPRWPANLQSLLATARRHGTAADWRRFGETAEAAGVHREAGYAYRRESAIYRRQGDVQAADVEAARADANTATVGLYYARPAGQADQAELFTGARLEPRVGCFLGAFIDRDDVLPSHLQDDQRHGDVPAFVQTVGRRHASYFTYLAYGQPFPAGWVQELRSQGAIPQLAWEPGSLAQVRDDAYLEGFVQAAAASQCPLFIRFASEMNGAWTPYHNDPADYIRAFRTVYQAFRRAPNVALIWCPNAIPRSSIDSYYPGDDYTDWVGVNFYSVPYVDNERRQPGDHIHPSDMVDYVYRKYAARKPMAIGEYAASHQSSLDVQARPEFATQRIAELYQSLSTQYPRIKLVNWYDCNNLVHGGPGRRLNNFLLTDDLAVLNTYRQAISPAWFLDAYTWQAPVRFEPMLSDNTLASPLVLRATVRCRTMQPGVYFVWDGQVVHATSDLSACTLRLDAVPPGSHALRLVVYDDRQHLVSDRQYRIHVPPP